MGLNLRSCCHECMVQVFHFRRKESDTMQDFYKKHHDCIRANPLNVETLEDQLQHKDWMDNYRDDYEQA